MTEQHSLTMRPSTLAVSAGGTQSWQEQSSVTHPPFDSEATVKGLQQTLDNLDPAIRAGGRDAHRFRTIVLVGTGSGQRTMQMIKEWICQNFRDVDCFSIFSGEFTRPAIHPRIDENALVFIVSKSGNTQTCKVAELLRGKAGRVLVFTQKSTNRIASLGNEAFTVGDTTEPFLGLSMLMLAAVGGFLHEKSGWPHLEQLKASLQALPGRYALAAEQNYDWARAQATALATLDHIYLIADGPHLINAHVWGTCILTEWLELHTQPFPGVEFKDGQHEIIRKMDVIVFRGLGEDQQIMNEVIEFCMPRARSFRVYDAKDLDMDGIDEMFRPILAPFVMQARIKVVSGHMSCMMKRPAGDRNFEGFRLKKT